MIRFGLILLLLASLKGYAQQTPTEKVNLGGVQDISVNSSQLGIILKQDVRIRDLFVVLDSLSLNYGVNEHLIVHANPWIIDSLAATDYYLKKKKGVYVYDQREWVILPSGTRLLIPERTMAKALSNRLSQLRIDINIPEFKLRVFRGDSVLYTFPVRVGQNAKKYLAMGNRITDLRTIPGEGKIVRHERNPVFYNPVNHHRFYMTYRDDDSLTVMPQIPWIETEINGLRNGQMIHPTTNPLTLKKACSNGCIGLSEGDAWIVYYHAPIGTPVTIRYKLEVPDGKGGLKQLPDIYGWKGAKIF